MFRAPDSWLPSAAPPLEELCDPGGRAKSILGSLLTQAFPTRRGMGAVGPAWRHPLDGQTSPLPQPLRAQFLGTCVCLHLSHPSSSGRGGWCHRLATQAQHTAVWTVCDHTSSWVMEKDTVLGLLFSTAAVKLALPACVSTLLLSLEKILPLCLQPMALCSYCILMFLTTCFLCKPCTLPPREVTMSDTAWCVSPGPVASLCSCSLSPRKASFLDHV